MSRVSKVVIGCRAVMANGGLVTFPGGHALALAAQHHSVPVICVTSISKVGVV
jgi:translation initiation factor eIF-2B subunit beta